MKLPKQSQPVIRVRIPILKGDDVGLGEVVRRITSRIGIHHCGGCAKRAAALNRYLVFTGQKSTSD